MADITIKRGLAAKAEAFVLRLFTCTYSLIDQGCMTMEHIMCVSRGSDDGNVRTEKRRTVRVVCMWISRADRTFLLAAEEPLLWINKREIG